MDVQAGVAAEQAVDRAAIEQAAEEAAPSVPYAPSWVDWLTAWIDRLPVPPWLAYLGLFGVLVAIAGAAGWADGSAASAFFNLEASTNAFYPVFGLALIHYLDGVARSTFEDFRPALDVSETEAARLRYDLSTVPALTGALVGLLGFAFALIGFGSDQRASEPAGSWTAARIVETGIEAFSLAVLAVLLYHTVRQLRLVSEIQALASRVDLFEATPLYAFSTLTARTGIGLALFPAYALLTNPSGAAFASTVSIYAVTLVVAAASFVLPLLGMQRRIAAEKRRLQAEADMRLKACLEAIHRSADEDRLDSVGGLNTLLASLSLERQMIAAMPTWPWQAGTARSVASAIMLPIVIWLITRVLERFV